MFFTDLVEISNANYDDNNVRGSETVFKSKAYVENKSGVSYEKDGEPIHYSMSIYLPSETSVFLTSRIKVDSMHGADPSNSEEGEKKIKGIRRPGGIRVSHIRVFV